MPETPTEGDVAEFVSRATGHAVREVRDLAGSVANHDFLVSLGDRSPVVVKTGPRGEIAAEAWCCRRLLGTGVPVPEVVALALDGGPGGWPAIVLGVVAGAPSDDPPVAFQAGAAFRKVHAQRLPGWGPLEISESPERNRAAGRYRSWPDAVRAEVSGLDELVRAGIVDAELARAARSRVLVGAVLDFDGAGVLLHRDLKRAHLLATVGGPAAGLAGIIDWGDAAVGDPRVDLARLSMAGPAVLAAFAAGYGAEPDGELIGCLARYRIMWNVSALGYEYRAGGDWFAAYRDRIAADVRLLG